MSIFKKAERTKTKLKLAVTGPSGSGKTYSALTLAKGLGKKVAVVDTERGSASLYSDLFAFDVLEIEAPYTTEKYMEAIKSAEQAGYDVIVLDSITHAWAGAGGLLEQKEQLDARATRGNSYTNWATITKKHEAFLASILHANVHLIATMRSKQDYVLVERNGKQVPQKVGMAPIQRDGAEYEFTIVFDVAMNHEAQASKDRTGIFTDSIFKISDDTSKKIRTWLDNANEVTAVNTPMPPEGAYVIDIGSLKDKTLKECSPFEISEVIRYIENEAPKPLGNKLKAFLEHAKPYLASLKITSTEEDNLQF